MTQAVLVGTTAAQPWRRLYPFEGRWVQVPAGRMHVVDEGPRDAPVMVLVHGNPTWSFYWRNVISALRHRYRVIAPDHLGCGLSDRPAHFSFRLAEHVDNLARVLDALEIDSYSLGVHDWGGAIGAGCALRAPERVDRLAVFNTAAFRSRRIPSSIALCRWPLFGPLAIQGFNAFARVALLRCICRRERVTPELSSGYLDPYDGWQAREALLRFVQDIPMRPEHPSWSTLTAIDEGLVALSGKPMLIMWGGQDFCFDRSFYEEWRRRFPQAEAHWLADCGHYVLEDAHEHIVPNLERLMERTS
ncbi:MAG: alpha/beta fold hydrolase [Myxococcota bacterium]